jgi:type I restriction enzyme M protein
MANPPFNVNKVDKTKLVDDPRFPFRLRAPDEPGSSTTSAGRL